MKFWIPFLLLLAALYAIGVDWAGGAFDLLGWILDSMKRALDAALNSPIGWRVKDGLATIGWTIGLIVLAFVVGLGVWIKREP